MKPPWAEEGKHPYQICSTCDWVTDDLETMFCEPCDQLGFNEKLNLVDPSEPSGDIEDLDQDR